MKKILVPKITFKNSVSDEKRIEIAYARLFDIARRKILVKRRLTKGMSQEYSRVQDERKIFNNRGSSQKTTGQQTDSLSVGQKREDTSF